MQNSSNRTIAVAGLIVAAVIAGVIAAVVIRARRA
jgi:hypothetical protein